MQERDRKTVTLVLGGVRSGKSRWAQQLAANAARVAYVATLQPCCLECPLERLNFDQCQDPWEFDLRSQFIQAQITTCTLCWRQSVSRIGTRRPGNWNASSQVDESTKPTGFSSIHVSARLH